MSSNDSQSSGDQASTLDDIKQLLQQLSDKTYQQQLAVTSLSDKFVPFQEQCNGQLLSQFLSQFQMRQ